MQQSEGCSGRVIPASAVQRVSAPVMVEAGESDRAVTVRPILEGDRVVGLEVCCSCGERTLIECDYGEETT